MLVNGEWDEWSNWSSCSVTCGLGEKQKSRTCTKPAPSNGGLNCTGDSTASELCVVGNCPGVYPVVARKRMLLYNKQTIKDSINV